MKGGNGYVLEPVCPRCGSALVGAIFRGVYGWEHFFKDRLKCMACGRLFEYDKDNVIAQVPRREEPLPHIFWWHDLAAKFKKQKRRAKVSEADRTGSEK